MERQVWTLAVAWGVVLSVFAGAVPVGNAAAVGNTVSSCTTIDSSGTYELGTDIANAGASPCIEITASDVVLDGGGHAVDGTSATDSVGISVAASGGGTVTNVTVRGVTLTDWAQGVSASGTDVAVNGSTFTRIGEASTARPAAVRLDGTTDVTVANNTFYGGGPGNPDVVEAINSPGLAFVDNNVTNWGNNGVTAVGSDQLFRGNEFAGTSKMADLFNADGAVIADNTYTGDGTGTAISVDGDGITVSGNDIDSTAVGIDVDDAVGVVVRDNDLDDLFFEGIRLRNLNGPVAQVEVRNNAVTGAEGVGILGTAVTDSTVADNVVTGGQDSGIRLVDATDTTLRNNTVRNNELSGIRVERSDGTTIRESVVLGNNGGGSYPNAGVYVNASTGVTIEDATVRNNRLAGLRVAYADGIEVRNSRITENCGGNFGVSLAESADALFVGTNVSNNTGVGMQVFDASPNLTVRDSTFSDNGGFAGYQGEPGNTLVGVTADGNAGDGLIVNENATVDGATVRDNDGLGLDANGNTTVRGAVARNNSGHGIEVGDDATVRDAVVTGNDGSGVKAAYDATLRNVSVTGNGIGVNAEANATMRGLAVRDNSGFGIGADEGATITDSVVGGNDNEQLRAVGVTTVTDTVVADVRFETAELYDVNVYDRDEQQSPLFPPGDRDIVGEPLGVETRQNDGYLDVTIAYTDGDVAGVNESSLALWRNGTDWTEVGGTLDEGANTLAVNVTTPGLYPVAVLGESVQTQTPTPTPSPTPTDDGGDGSPGSGDDADGSDDARQSGGSDGSSGDDGDGSTPTTTVTTTTTATPSPTPTETTSPTATSPPATSPTPSPTTAPTDSATPTASATTTTGQSGFGLLAGAGLLAGVVALLAILVVAGRRR